MVDMEFIDRCWRCGRPIHEPLSVYTGMGPICRKASGIVETRGWNALESVHWWREDKYEYYARLVDEIRQEMQWWRMRLMLIEPVAEILFDAALAAVEGLQRTSPASGLVVMGFLWKLVAQIRFVLEPTLQTLKNANVVYVLWVEGVPELRRTMQNVERILCGLGAQEDAVEFAAVRSKDRAVRKSNQLVVPAEGIE